MLSYDSLLAHSAERGMPPGKLRGAVREYVQVLTLRSLFRLKAAAPLVFLGGTALRLGHGLPRFSEDLDFDVDRLGIRAWGGLLEETAHGLTRHGFSVEAAASEKGSLLSGDLRFKGLLQAYRLSADPGEKLRVKLEANRPRYRLSVEARVIAGFGEMVPVPFAAPGLLFAEKILALLSRELARDVYDLFFMAGKRWRPDPRVLAARGVHGDPGKLIVERVRGLGHDRLARLARSFEPFLFDPAQSDLIRRADALLPGALEYL